VKVTATLLLRCNAPLHIVVDVGDMKTMASVPHQVYESCSEKDLRLHAQDEYADLPSSNLLNASIESGCKIGPVPMPSGEHKQGLRVMRQAVLAQRLGTAQRSMGSGR